MTKEEIELKDFGEDEGKQKEGEGEGGEEDFEREGKENGAGEGFESVVVMDRDEAKDPLLQREGEEREREEEAGRDEEYDRDNGLTAETFSRGPLLFI